PILHIWWIVTIGTAISVKSAVRPTPAGGLGVEVGPGFRVRNQLRSSFTHSSRQDRQSLLSCHYFSSFASLALPENGEGAPGAEAVLFDTLHQGGSHAQSRRASLVASHRGSHEAEEPSRDAVAAVFLAAVPGSSGNARPPID